MSVIECTKNTQCPELEIETRNRLYGTKSTIRDWINEILRLFEGDTRRRQLPHNKSQAAKQLGISRMTINEYLKIAKNHGLCEIDEITGKIKLPEKVMQDKIYERMMDDDFAKNPLISEWITYMRAQNGGEGLVQWSTKVSSLRVICNTLKIQPSQLILNKETTRKYWINFVEHLKNNTAVFDKANNRKYKSIQTAQVGYKAALRIFCARYDITWARGQDEVMGNRVVNHGQQAHIRLTATDLEILEAFLLENYGIDSDEYRLIWYGIESCCRDKALFSTKLDWDEIDDDDGKIFILRAFESKTKKHNGGWWEKFVTRPQTQQSLLLHKKRGNTFLWTPRNSANTTGKHQRADFREVFRNIWRAIGKIPDYEACVAKRKDGYKETGNYFFDHPVHAVRHIGAHYWLAKTNYDYGIVAEIGGWMTIDELKKSYGAMPPEMKYKKVKLASQKHLGSAA